MYKPEENILAEIIMVVLDLQLRRSSLADFFNLSFTTFTTLLRKRNIPFLLTPFESSKGGLKSHKFDT